MFGPAKQMAKAGRFGDTILAHINPQEAALLKARGGSGTVNPMTGAMEFVNEEDFDPDFYLAQNRDVELSGMNPWEHYNTFVNQGDETRAGNLEQQQIKDLGSFTGTFDEDFYSANNQDVVDAIAGGTYEGTLKDHFYTHGRQEGRTFNQMQQDLKDAGTEIERFGSNQYGGQSDRSIQRSNILAGSNAVGGERGFAGSRDYLNEDMTNLRSNLIGEGDFAFDLIGNTATMLNRDLEDTIQGRDVAIDSGYLGNFDPTTLAAFNEDYTSNDGTTTSNQNDQDPSTIFTAANTSNISRAGVDITPQRNAIRGIGYEGRFGAGGAEEFVTEKLGEYGLSTTGNVQNDAALISNAQENEALQTQLTEALAALNDAVASASVPSNTLNVTAPPAPVNTEPSTDVSTVIPTPTMPFATPSPAAPSASVQSVPSFMNNFRGTRINPFTGALEYLPANITPSAFSQTVLNPRFSGGFGTNIRL